MSTTNKDDEWFIPAIKSLSKKKNISQELQLGNMCTHCVCSKQCNGTHNKDGIDYLDPRDIPYIFKSFCKDPRKNCKEINDAIQKLIIDPESILYEEKIDPIVITCVHNHIYRSCNNCNEGRTSTFMIGDDEFRYCWSKLINGKNNSHNEKQNKNVFFGIHWDVKMIVIDNVIDSYEIIPFSKDFSKDDYSYKENRRTYDSPLTIDTTRSERSERSFHKKDSNSWSEPPTTISTEFKGESNHEFNLLKKELKLLKQELTLKDREFGHDIKESICEINELKYKFEEISKENDLNKNKLSIQKETLVNEIRENIDLVDKTVVSQFLNTYL
jgi:hypothetical protein